LVVSAFAWSIKACGANMMIPSYGAVFADEADLSTCAEQLVVDKPIAAKNDNNIFFIVSCFFILF
jgi:hypothetical protein